MAELRARIPAAKAKPNYAITSVDNALKLAATLQLEGRLSVSEAAERLEVAPSTAHRLLSMLVYRDFALQDADRLYRPGPVLLLAGHTHSSSSELRRIVLPHLEELATQLDETVNVAVRVGDQTRFIASVEGMQSLRVSSREGMVLPAHRTSPGVSLLADLTDAELATLYDEERFVGRMDQRPDMARLQRDIAAVRKTGCVLNKERSEVGIVAVGVPLRDRNGRTIAGMAVSIPSPRYRDQDLPRYQAALLASARAIDLDLRRNDITV